MIPLIDLLTRFKNLTNTDKAKKEIICKEIKNITGVIIDFKNIILSKNIIILKLNPIIRTEILLKKQEILKNIKSSKNMSYILDIK